jgi:hypothetical protein
MRFPATNSPHASSYCPKCESIGGTSTAFSVAFYLRAHHLLVKVLVLASLLLLPHTVSAQELAPTEHTSFNFPPDGANVILPFPPELAQLTGLSNWPPKWVSPPFTPNMAKLFNPLATARLNDIAVPPNPNGLTFSLVCRLMRRVLSNIR